MKRLFLTVGFFIVSIIFLSTCDSPVGDLNSGDQNQDQTDPLLVSSIPPGTPPAMADSIRQAAWQQFKSQNGPEWQITWNERTGVPLTVFSGTSKKSYQGSPEQAARSFLKEYAGLFGMRADLSDLKLDRTNTRKGITHVRFQQTYKNIPVWEGDYLVHLNSDGRIEMVNGNYYPSIQSSTSPGFGESAARQTALDDLGSSVSLHGEISSELIIYPTEQPKKFRLAWRVLVPANAPVGGDWQYFVDAASGTIVEKVNLTTSIVGDGDILEGHPGLTPAPVNRDFYRLDGSGYLQGNHAKVFNDVAERAFSSEHSFQFNINNAHFDEANVYWHLDTYRASFLETNLTFFGNFGSDGDEDIVAWVHDVTVNPNNAGWSPITQELRFGNNLEFAKEDKIIYHEFTHGAVDVAHGGIDPEPNEEGAIDEGNADYFSGAYTGRPRIGESITNDEDDIRDMNNPIISTYSEYIAKKDGDFPGEDSPAGFVEEHDGGELWSAVLWDLRSIIDSYTANNLVFEALGYISSNPTFIEYRNAMIEADDFNYQGDHIIDIMDTFAARGIGEPAPPIWVYIDGPGFISSFGDFEYVANTAWEDGPVSYQWSILWEQSSTWQDLGTSPTQTVFINNDYDFQLRVDVQDSENSNSATTSVTVTL